MNEPVTPARRALTRPDPMPNPTSNVAAAFSFSAPARQLRRLAGRTGAALLAGLVIAGTGFSPAALRAAPAGVNPNLHEIVLPVETVRYKETDNPGYPLAAAICSVCHSADYVRTQPPLLTRANWSAEVTKMMKVYGAPVPPAAVDPITDYLVRTYGNERPGLPPVTPPPASAAPAPAAGH